MKKRDEKKIKIEITIMRLNFFKNTFILFGKVDFTTLKISRCLCIRVGLLGTWELSHFTRRKHSQHCICLQATTCTHATYLPGDAHNFVHSLNINNGSSPFTLSSTWIDSLKIGR